MKVLDQGSQHADKVNYPVVRERDIDALDMLLAALA